MKNFKYFKISKTKNLRYIDNNYNKKLYIVFLPGFMSDIEGKKPQFFKKFADKNKLGFLTLEYLGHGKSSGKFTKGNISIWTSNVKFLIKKIIRKNNFIIVGSSMGAWIAINLFQYFQNQIKGFVGIGAAPEFLSRLMWNKFPKKIRQDIKKKGVVEIVNGQYKYPITFQLIKDGEKNKVLQKKILKNIHISMFHGKNDEVVPVSFSRKVLAIFKRAKKDLFVIKKGDHSLSDSKSLRIIKNQLMVIIKDIL